MARRYWVYSGAAFLGMLAMVLGLLWLDRATQPYVDLRADSAVPWRPSDATFPPLGDERRDVDALLAVDFSGSMRGTEEMPATDPGELRLNAAELMVTSLASDVFPRATRMGYMAFGTGVEIFEPLSPVESADVRKELIRKLRTPSYSEYTNLVEALRIAETVLFPAGERASSNTPALVLLTDGDPRGGPSDNNEQGIRSAVQSLTDKGAMVFVVILRNTDVTREASQLTTWRGIWSQIADSNPRLTYVEAQRAEELEGIYNKIRQRLVEEGAPPGERAIYNPLDVDATISMPPNLLQAHLLVSKPSSLTRIDLITPDGVPFAADPDADPRNEILDTDLYYRYRIYRPQGGSWKLSTNSIDPIYYLLNPESLYSARIAWGRGSPYISPDALSTIPLVVVDENGTPTDKMFDLEASVIRTAQREDGAFVEEEIPLPEPRSQSGGITYSTEVTPDLLSSDQSLTLQVTGEAGDGTPVNVSLSRILAARTPDGVVLQFPPSIECEDETLQIWPPAIHCGNVVTATLRIQGTDRLINNTLAGTLFMPRGGTQRMYIVSEGVLQESVGPLSTAGTYEIAAEATGRVGDDMYWSARAEESSELLWPTWVQKRREQLKTGAVLLLILTLWKPVVVRMLLPLFRKARFAPSGYYVVGEEQYPFNAYRTAVKRRKLFVLTIGNWKNRNNDIRVDEDCSRTLGSSSRRARSLTLPGIQDSLKMWMCNEPRGRLIAWPLHGIHAETADYFWEEVPEYAPQPISVGRSSILLAQTDWTQENP